MEIRAAVFITIALFMPSAVAWDGYDWDKGAYIEIEKGSLVRGGRDIEIYDFGSGEYKEVEVQSIRRRGEKVEIEVIESDTGEERTFEMDDRD